MAELNDNDLTQVTGGYLSGVEKSSLDDLKWCEACKKHIPKADYDKHIKTHAGLANQFKLSIKPQ